MYCYVCVLCIWSCVGFFGFYVCTQIDTFHHTCLFVTILLRVIWLCISMKNTANKLPQAKLRVHFVVYEVEFTACKDDQLQVFELLLHCLITSLTVRYEIFSELSSYLPTVKKKKKVKCINSVVIKLCSQ